MVADAVRVALELHEAPAASRSFAMAALPAGVLDVIKGAAGSEKTLGQLELDTGLPREKLQAACQFYVEQVLLARNTDHYWVLGVTPDATERVIAEHYRWMLRWLHPDSHRSGWHATFAQRINGAFAELRVQEKRRIYDESRHADNDSGWQPQRYPVLAHVAPWTSTSREPTASNEDVSPQPARGAFKLWLTPIRVVVAVLLVAVVVVAFLPREAEEVEREQVANVPREAPAPTPVPVPASVPQPNPKPTPRESTPARARVAAASIRAVVVPPPPTVPDPAAVQLIERFAAAYSSGNVLDVLNMAANGGAGASELATVGSSLERFQREHAAEGALQVRSTRVAAYAVAPTVTAVMTNPGAAGVRVSVRQQADGQWTIESVTPLQPVQPQAAQ